jgi:hypothetical protein
MNAIALKIEESIVDVYILDKKKILSIPMIFDSDPSDKVVQLDTFIFCDTDDYYNKVLSSYIGLILSYLPSMLDVDDLVNDGYIAVCITNHKDYPEGTELVIDLNYLTKYYSAKELQRFVAKFLSIAEEAGQLDGIRKTFGGSPYFWVGDHIFKIN